jgi:hypothetical protein
VEVETIPIDVFDGELAQTPRLSLERFDNACAPRAKFRASRVDVRGKDPMDRRFEPTASPVEENRDVVARDGADIAPGISQPISNPRASR